MAKDFVIPGGGFQGLEAANEKLRRWGREQGKGCGATAVAIRNRTLLHVVAFGYQFPLSVCVGVVGSAVRMIKTPNLKI